jgi:hypothetical protein
LRAPRPADHAPVRRSKTSPHCRCDASRTFRCSIASGSFAKTSAPYDASYVALAEALDAVLLTADRRLAKAVGVLCEVDILR